MSAASQAPRAACPDPVSPASSRIFKESEPHVVFEIFDIVRIRNLTVSEREVDGSSAEPPQPRIGETGSVVDALGDGLYLVEHATDDGEPIWVAEFHEGELELVERASSRD